MRYPAIQYTKEIHWRSYNSKKKYKYTYSKIKNFGLTKYYNLLKNQKHIESSYFSEILLNFKFNISDVSYYFLDQITPKKI